ncbi:MAG: hypothetical protein ACXWAT_14695 [Methylobacter sp.]
MTYRTKYLQTLFIAILYIYGPTITAQTANTNPKDLISGGIVLHADSYGHYRGTVLINKRLTTNRHALK